MINSLPTFPTTTCPKVKYNFLSMGPTFAYLSLQAHLPPYSASCFPCTFICRHGIVLHLYSVAPAIHSTRDSSLSPPPFRQFYWLIHPLRLDSGPGQSSLNFQTGSATFGFHCPLGFLPAHIHIKHIGLLFPTHLLHPQTLHELGVPHAKHSACYQAGTQ